MNLPDLLTRKDRAVIFEAGSAVSKNVGAPDRRMRAIELAPGTVLRLKDAHTYNLLFDQPSDLRWQVAEGEGVRITAESDTLKAVVAEECGTANILFQWPLWTLDNGYDLVLEAVGTEPVTIEVGRLLDPRAKMKALIMGSGLELGPGLTPRILPSHDMSIEYVEERHPEEWQQIYGHGSASMDQLTPEVLARYRVGSALTLEEWPEASLDFIFSNHVFEHLSNPIQVLRNWLGRLKPGGTILAVVPDTRFSFDLRQQTSTLEEMLSEEAEGGYTISDAKYQKWCDFTAPYNTVEDLRKRRYSVHVHYYTPALFRRMADHLGVSIFLDTVPNNKEFGVILRKPVSSMLG